jgi:hypothetical protein
VAIIGAVTPKTAANFSPNTVKNRAAGANNALSGTGPTTVGQFVQNTTHPSVAWALRVTSGANHLMTQPLLSSAFNNPYPTPAEVDTWTDGDSLELLEPVHVYIKFLRTRNVSGDKNSGKLTVYGCVAFDPSGTPGTATVNVDANQGNVTFIQVRCDSALNLTGGAGGGQPGFWSTNCYYAGGAVEELGSSAFFAGAINVSAGPGCFMASGALENLYDGDLIFTSNGTPGGVVTLGSSNAGNALGTVCLDLDTGLLTEAIGSLVLSPQFYTTTTVYGSTTANADNISLDGTARLVFDSVTTAAGAMTFPNAIAGGLLLNGQQVSAFISTAANVGTIHTGVATTVTNFDTHGQMGLWPAFGASVTSSLSA